jgi:phosphoglucosamine mutase
MGRLFGTDGVRGIAGSELTAGLAMDLAAAAAGVLVGTGAFAPTGRAAAGGAAAGSTAAGSTAAGSATAGSGQAGNRSPGPAAPGNRAPAWPSSR